MLEPFHNRIHADRMAIGRLRQLHGLPIIGAGAGEQTECTRQQGGAMDCGGSHGVTPSK